MIKYKRTFYYKYQLTEDYYCYTGICPPKEIDHEYFTLSYLGYLTVKKGYSWDGATCAFDTENFMRGSLVHDVFYQMFRENLLDISLRKRSDELLIRLCREDGMNRFRRLWVYAGVRLFGASSAELEND